MIEWATSASSSTDSLHIRLPRLGDAVSTCKLLQEFEKYGNVSRVELVDGDDHKDGTAGSEQRCALVSFFDTRAADRAREALGDACSPAPSHGHRMLRLLGDATMEATVASEVANIERTQEGDFLLEFFDVRVAARVAATAYAAGVETKAKVEAGHVGAEDATVAPATDSLCGDQPPASSDSAGRQPPASSSGGRKELSARIRESQLNWDDL